MRGGGVQGKDITEEKGCFLYPRELEMQHRMVMPSTGQKLPWETGRETCVTPMLLPPITTDVVGPLYVPCFACLTLSRLLHLPETVIRSA